MKSLGTVKEIWRYPVKGMAGEKLEKCTINAHGLKGDRCWALWDVARQEIQSCKFRPELLMCRASSRQNLADPHVDITFSDGSCIGSDDPLIHQKLSELVGHASTLERLEFNREQSFFKRYKGAERGWLEELKSTFDREENEPYPDFSDLPQEVEEYVTVPGSFFLVSPFHIISTATLAYFKHKLPEADWNSERFRPNLIIDTNPETNSLLEQGWIGKHISIANINVNCTGTTPRCGAITRAQQELAFDKTMLRSVIKEAEQNLGIYGSILDEGLISVGDTVESQH
jgi:uncharacterized protein YcbX